MSKLTKAERDALPSSSFGDPSRRLFPLLDCSDVSDAASLIGKAKNPDAVKARIMDFASKKSCPIPDAWKESSKMSVTFALEDSNRRVEGDFAVYPNALLFQAGEYTDKGFEMSPEEMFIACEQFSDPVGGNIEHSDFLKGRACEVRSIRLDDADSSTLRGEVAVPLWLDSQLEDHERKLSCEWSRESKTLTGIGLVVHPRVEEAALVSAYAAFAAKHDTPQGQMALQRIHQVAAESGAVCAKGNVAMASSHEASAIQQIHNLTTDHGAACSSTKSGSMPSMYSAQSATNAATISTPPKEGRSMSSWKDRLLAAISGMPEDPDEEPKPDPVPAVAPPVTLSAPPAPVISDETRRADAATQRADALAVENQRLLQERIVERAVAFTDKLLNESRALPHEREQLIADYVVRATDDSLYSVVKFGSEGQTTSRVAIFEATQMARAPHKLTAAEITPALFSILQGHRETPIQDAGDRKASEDELRKLIGMTSQGQAYLTDANRSAPSAPATNGRA